MNKLVKVNYISKYVIIHVNMTYHVQLTLLSVYLRLILRKIVLYIIYNHI